MPADMNELQNCLIEMKNIFFDPSKNSVRSQEFIQRLHRYCASELYKLLDKNKVQLISLDDMYRRPGDPHYPIIKIEPDKYQLMQEATLFGSHKNKDEDVVLTQYANGPQIAIGVRSEMSSIGKNVINYYEGIIGECTSLHDRFPMATLGYVYLLPNKALVPDRKTGKYEIPDLDRIENLFKKITNRKDWHDPHDVYEHFAFIKVDFYSNPPKILSTCPELSIETFFDKLIATHNDRNLFNPL